MTGTTRVLMCVAVAVALAGCGALKKFTGQRDDSVLPGEREAILPPDQTRNPPVSQVGNADTARDLAAPCDPEIEVCEPNGDLPADDSAVSGGGVFQDG